MNAASEQRESTEDEGRDSDVCNWYYDNESEAWHAECGYEFVIYNDTPTENGMHFCPHCGGVLIEEVLH